MIVIKNCVIKIAIYVLRKLVKGEFDTGKLMLPINKRHGYMIIRKNPAMFPNFVGFRIHSLHGSS